jgi:beta-xylosidase
MDFHPRHGTVIPLTTQEYKRLLTKWYPQGNVMSRPSNKHVRMNNTVVNDNNVELSVIPGTDLTKLDPQFSHPKEFVVKPVGPQNFTQGPVRYEIKMDKSTVQVEVRAVPYANPVLPGYFADPDIMFSEKEKKFYLYPTSDGYTNWSGAHFKAFSSTDLIHWRDEGTILDLKRDVPWGQRNAWAPTIVERKMNNDYRYYYYYTAAQKIGVATSGSPVGPFVDSGKPLIETKPPGVNGGQEIDPAVFHDPISGKYFLYWGNGYMAAVVLNDDMISFHPDSVQVITPDTTFREGSYVIFRNGLYYFFWSEDDTRSPNYKVRYGTSASPLGPIQIPEGNIVIQRSDVRGIHATGHNSILKIPGRDEWYIVYHRFTYPRGNEMGESAGYHREVCIDRLNFSKDGKIMEVVPTKEGISSVQVQQD